MSTYATVNAVASLVILAWATWCVLSPCIRDGLAGKILYSMAGVSALLMFMERGWEEPSHAQVLFNVTIAGLGIRNALICYFWGSVIRRMRDIRSRRC